MYLQIKSKIMKNEKHSFSPEESLSLISEMINNVKSDFQHNAFYFLLWGWTIALACIVHFAIIMILIRLELFDKISLFSFLNWGVFVGAGAIIQYSYMAKNHAKAKSLYNRFFRIMWQMAGLTMIVAALICLKFNMYPTPIILTITAMATLTAGIIIRFTPLILGGILFFIAALISTYLFYDYSLLICAFAIILGYIIPGYMLRNLETKQNV